MSYQINALSSSLSITCALPDCGACSAKRWFSRKPLLISFFGAAVVKTARETASWWKIQPQLTISKLISLGVSLTRSAEGNFNFRLHFIVHFMCKKNTIEHQPTEVFCLFTLTVLIDFCGFAADLSEFWTSQTNASNKERDWSIHVVSQSLQVSQLCTNRNKSVICLYLQMEIAAMLLLGLYECNLPIVSTSNCWA